MAISKEELKKLAELARIELNEKELNTFQHNIDSILDFVSQVQEVSEKGNNSGSPAGVWKMIKNKFREDENPHEGGLYTERILNEAPHREGDYFKVKKIL